MPCLGYYGYASWMLWWLLWKVKVITPLCQYKWHSSRPSVMTEVFGHTVYCSSKLNSCSLSVYWQSVAVKECAAMSGVRYEWGYRGTLSVGLGMTVPLGNVQLWVDGYGLVHSLANAQAMANSQPSPITHLAGQRWARGSIALCYPQPCKLWISCGSRWADAAELISIRIRRTPGWWSYVYGWIQIVGISRFGIWFKLDDLMTC